jgi:hypothetical protein
MGHKPMAFFFEAQKTIFSEQSAEIKKKTESTFTFRRSAIT